MTQYLGKTDPKASGIYAIVAPSGRAYIGSAKNIAKRWREHRKHLLCGIHVNKPLQKAFYKYGEYLTYIVLEFCDNTQLLAREQAYFDTHDFSRLYNIARHADAPSRGRKWSTETKEKMRLAATGRKHTELTKLKVSFAQIGRVTSEETRARMSRARKGRDRHDIPVSASGYRGVYKQASGGWMARTDTKEPRRTIGTYRSAELAYAMRLLWISAAEVRP